MAERTNEENKTRTRANEPVGRDTGEHRRREERHLFKLAELDDYKVASDDPDVRGWPVLDRDKQEFGRVDELIVEKDQEKVRYLDVVPNTDRSVDQGDQHILIPVGAARIDDDNDNVIVDNLDQERLRSYPVLRGDYISRDLEHQVGESFERPRPIDAGQRSSGEGGYYEHELYDENRFYSGRNKKRTS